MKGIRLYNYLSIAIFLALSFFVQTASAIEYGMLGGKPAYPDSAVENSDSWFIYNIAAGESKEDAIEVMNLFEETLEVSVYAADTIKSSGGGFALKQFSEDNFEVGLWIKFYPEPVPEFFKALFEKKDNKIIELCKMTREDMLKDEDLFEDIEISDEQISSLEEWCKGKNLVEKTFASKERAIIPFIFSVPEGADVGEHTGGILIQKKATDDVSQATGSNVKLTTRVGVRIYETVPGDIIKKIKIEGFQVVKHFSEFDFSDWFGEVKKPKEFLIETHITNSGNVSIEHENNLQVRDLLFKKKNEDVARKFQILKGDKFLANYSWKKPLFGYYSFQSEIKYNNGTSDEVLKSDLVKMWVIPWREISIFSIILLFVGIGLFFYFRRQRKLYGGIGWVTYQASKGDTIGSLAQKYELDWKTLAKTNKMKPPYLLIEEQIIIVPPTAENEAQNDILITAKETSEEEKAEVMKMDVSKNIAAEIKIEEPSSFEKYSDLVVQESEVLKEKESSSFSNITEKARVFLFKNKWLLIGGAIFMLMVAVIIYLLLSIQGLKEATIEGKTSISSSNLEQPIVQVQQDAQVEKSDIVQQEADKSDEPEHPKTDIEIVVLNGGGIVGSAGKIKDFLLNEGYSLAEAANAKSSEYSGKMIYYAEGFEQDAIVLSEEISSAEEKIEIKKGIPEGEEEKDLVIILGK